MKKFYFRSRLSECVQKYTKSQIWGKKKEKKKYFSTHFSTFVSMTGNNSRTRKSRLSLLFEAIVGHGMSDNGSQLRHVSSTYHFFFGWLNFQFYMMRIHLLCSVATHSLASFSTVHNYVYSFFFYHLHFLCIFRICFCFWLRVIYGYPGPFTRIFQKCILMIPYHFLNLSSGGLKNTHTLLSSEMWRWHRVYIVPVCKIRFHVVLHLSEKL